MKDDDGSRVDRLTGTDNTDNNHEYWRITSTDGTQYFFGLRGASRSTWTVPVFGNHPGEDCYRAGDFAGSWCEQAYRWNLDHVVDPNGNTTTFHYQTESNLYGRNLSQAAHSYHRGGWLEHVDYGTHTGVPGGVAPAQVWFTAADRCVTPGPTCVPSQPGNWVDVPWDQQCTSGTCAGKTSPTFFTQKRLAAITTKVWTGSGYRDVESWTLGHRYLNPGDSSSAALWLESIGHTGQIGSATPGPEVNFNEVPMSNRVDIDGDTLPPLVRYRISSIDNGTGADVAVQYSQRECSRKSGVVPVAESNTMRCQPTYWTPPAGTQPILDWFHKYVVTSVTETDNTGGGRPVLTSYEYLSAPAWHYDDEDGLVPPERKTWSQWRGYGKVGVITGDGVAGNGEPAPRGRTVTTYLRGMDEDKQPTGRRNVWVDNTDAGSIEDHELFQGTAYETITYRAVGDDTVISATVTNPWKSAATATNTRPWGAESAFLIDTESVRERVALEAGGWRRSEVVNTFDQRTGLQLASSDLGDTGTAADDRCTRTTYLSNTEAWLLAYPSRIETVGVACTASASYPQDLLADVRTAYDGAEPGVAPVRGNITRTEQATSWSGGEPGYVTVSRAGHDRYGRVTEAWDAAGERSTTAYTPNQGGPVTRTVTTNPLGHTTTTDLEPAWALPVRVTDANQRSTDLAYDGLGRLLKVWLPGRDKASQTPNSEYTYRVGRTAANLVTAKTLLPDGLSYKYAYAFYDGLLRSRQTQVASPGIHGGRILTESFYDSRNLTWKSSGPYFNGAPPDVNLVTPVNDNDVSSQTVTTFDGTGRPTEATFRELGQSKWTTSTRYGGDRVHLNPPAGAPATTTITDARGQTTELRQYTGAAPGSSYQATRYTYTDRGELASLRDPANNEWTFSYDLRGQKTVTTDPDKGATTLRYDDAGRLASSTDARNLTLAFAYDKLGRKTAVHEDSLTGTKRSEWTFDQPGGLGLPAASTRYHNGHAYRFAVDGYDVGGRPTGSTVTVPPVEGALAGSYHTANAYLPDGSPDWVSLPAVGGLPAEKLTTGYTALGLPNTLTTDAPTPFARLSVSATRYTDLAELSQIELVSSNSPNALWQTFAYERGTRRLSQFFLEREQTGAQQALLNFSYDPAGNLTRLADTPAATGLARDHQCFRYDHLRRLTEAWTPTTDNCTPNPTTATLGGPAPYWHSYGHDPVGNRATETHHTTGGDTTRTYTYPAPATPQPHTLRTVTTTRPGALTSTDTFSYNQTGDTTSRAVADRPTRTLTWDREGHLATDTPAGGAPTSYLYTPDGQPCSAKTPPAPPCSSATPNCAAPPAARPTRQPAPATTPTPAPTSPCAPPPP
ncbi:MAG TPA: SpvB/TcaC N-terminal domain-containing protein [Actinophytocola sp.]|uniref:SpvB/TcaC N-terminal domain-containing protein n=1 Tax=Actinophytocola sp. TaxID=1872138 RepID=UPI002DBA3350|nr:SpvB/TcaC N-terminal domain-containing protein [Actinophytocola sp.]HEU5476184.1 SpvB/TcaC N-terminal domain-containing protein [Actinophytocola sp.]